MKPGTTLYELLIVLSILALMAMIAAPTARHGLNAMQVRSARETAYGMALRARAVALARGGAEFVIDPSASSVSVVDSDGVTADRALLQPSGVQVSVDGVSSGRISLRYDARGIGRMTSRTIRIRKGIAETGLTVSSYGRVRRW